MKILALDLATKTGWAHSNGTSGTQDLKPRRGDSPGMRWIEFRGWLNRLLDCDPVNLIVYEQAHHRGGAATHCAHGFIATLEAVAAERGIEITSRHTSQIKALATGKGNAGKEVVLEAARQRWGYATVRDDNQADALWLLELVKKEVGETKLERTA